MRSTGGSGNRKSAVESNGPKAWGDGSRVACRDEAPGARAG